MIRIHWKDFDGSAGTVYKKTSEEAQRGVVSLQERGINPIVTRFTDEEWAKVKRQARRNQDNEEV